MSRKRNEVDYKRILNTERFMLIGVALATFLICCLGLYIALSKGRLEIVYLNQDKIDAPVALPKIRSDASAVHIDRWVRGFVRRYIAHYFLHPDDTDVFAEKAVRWIHAHSGNKGQLRASSFARDIAGYNRLRREKYAMFFPVNDTIGIKIRKSSSSDDTYFIEIPGTYQSFVRETGEVFFDAKLKMVIKSTSIDGTPSSLGMPNLTGLDVTDGTIEFVEDINRPGEVTRVSIF